MTDGQKYFPEAGEVPSLAIAFTNLMFAHARFEAEVRALQGAITNRQTFAELARNQWTARERPERMVQLIKEHLGNEVLEAESIGTVLSHAIAPCDERNLLVHGEWWLFDPQTSTITVRPGRRLNEHQRPEHREFTEVVISALAEKFKDLEAKLYKLRRAIEKRTTCQP